MDALSGEEISGFLSGKLPEWTFNREFITRSFKFKNFVEAFSFMTAVALEAEKLDHHPDWSNVYNNLVINLRTHDADGITSLDFDLAQKIDKLFSLYN